MLNSENRKIAHQFLLPDYLTDCTIYNSEFYFHDVPQTTNLENNYSRDFPGGPVVDSTHPMQGAWV